MYRDAENGYRYYDIRQSAQLDMIQHMKALGMSLKDIREQMTHFELDMFKTSPAPEPGGAGVKIQGADVPEKGHRADT